MCTEVPEDCWVIRELCGGGRNSMDRCGHWALCTGHGHKT